MTEGGSEKTPKRSSSKVVALFEGAAEAPPAGPGGGEEPRPIEFSNDALAALLSDDLGPDWRHVPAQWLYYNGAAWTDVPEHRVLNRSRLVCRRAANEARGERLQHSISSKSTIYAVAALTATAPRHATEADQFDRNNWLLNCPDGTYDLRTGDRLPHDRERLLRKIAPVAPEGDAPVWHSFLREAVGRDPEMLEYLQRVAGYCLTGEISEHAIFFLYGPGGTGKTIFISTLMAAMGEYATAATMDLFIITPGVQHPTELAHLAGRRLVTASETEENRRWNESRLKAITGGGPVAARYIRGDVFVFTPICKLLMCGNHRPSMRSADDAMRRRFHLIPFVHKPAKLDKALPEKLHAELGGILRWAIAGALKWHREGLAPPRSVVDATDEYFSSEDTLGLWMQERCTTEAVATALTRDLYKDFASWAKLANEYIHSEKKFAQKLEQRGLKKWRDTAGRRGFRGIAPLVRQDELALGGAGGGAVRSEGEGLPDWRADPGDDYDR